ncbi:MAG: SDR family NAD(P)-dependent oxidoreductase [Gammaproteobacteria bacterium]|nr:SDR family NAD(P)-dependent oxidoreductase [Gammaproteobacteria bacterium]
MLIKDKIAVITGAASGIGRATAAELARRGVRGIALVDMAEAVNEVAAELNAINGHEIARPFQGNTTDENFRREVFKTMRRDYGVVNLCIPAAGITRDRLAVKIDKNTKQADVYPVENFRLVTEVNLIAPIYWALETVANLAQDRAERGVGKWHPTEGLQGAIIFIGSVSSQGNKGQISYSTAKAGLEGAAETLMKEAIFYGVRCGVIHPGFTDTPMVRAMGDAYIEANVLPATQLGRLIRTDEIADAICFMITNSAVSGQLWADAGWHPMP